MRGFSEQERSQIKEELISAGQECFSRYGPERTRIEDLTEPAGIAKPTFYQFFDSKGELLLEVILREFEAHSEQLRSEIEQEEAPRDALHHFFTRFTEMMEESPTLQEPLVGSYPRELFRNVPREKIDSVKQAWAQAYLPIIQHIQSESEGPFSERDPISVLMLLRPVALMQIHGMKGTTHSEEKFDEMQEEHIETLVSGLLCSDEGAHQKRDTYDESRRSEG